MSFTLPVVDLSAAVVGTTGSVSWAAVAPQAAYAASGTTPHLAIFNESGCGLTLQLSTGEQLFLPAGGWRNIALNPACTSFSYSVAYVMNGALVDSLIVVWFGPEEEPPPPTILGNSPIGGSVTSSISTELKGAGQTYSLTEVDVGTSPGLFPAAHSNAISLVLGIIDSLGTIHTGIALTRDPNIAGSAQSTFYGALQLPTGVTFTQYNGDTTVGNGVPAIVAIAENTAVTATTLTSIVTYTTPNDGNNHTIRANAWSDINNGTSGNNISLQVVYTDPRTGTTNTTPFSAATSTAAVSYNGATSIGNGRAPMYPCVVYCKPNTTVTIQYRDPTNTPNDHITAFIERLS